MCLPTPTRAGIRHIEGDRTGPASSTLRMVSDLRAYTPDHPNDCVVDQPALQNTHGPVGAGLCACPYPLMRTDSSVDFADGAGHNPLTIRNEELFSDSKTGRGAAPQGGGVHGYDDKRDQHLDEMRRRFATLVFDNIKEVAKAGQGRPRPKDHAPSSWRHPRGCGGFCIQT